MKEQRTGFTLVELIVASVCGSLLLGLSLPMIQGGREQANRIRCLNNLGNIGIASLDYNDVNGQLPPYMGIPENLPSVNGFYQDALNYQLTYSLAQMLNFTGHSDLVDLVDPIAFDSRIRTIAYVGYAQFADDWLLGIDKNMRGIRSIAIDVQFPKFRCPSDPNAPTKQILFGPHPTNNAAQATYMFPTDSIHDFSITNYVGNMGGHPITDTPDDINLEGFHGPMRSRQSDSVEGIFDGASNVVLFGESLGEIRLKHINRRFSMAMGGLAIGRADLYELDSVFGTATDASWAQFGSAHPDVVNIVRTDGSAQSINRDVDSINFGRFCGVADGQPFLDFAND